MKPDLDIKRPEWSEIVCAAIARSSVRGLPKPAGLPANGDLTLQCNVYGRHRVVYRMPGRIVTLGTVRETYQQVVRQEWLQDNPITLESGRRVVVTFDDGNPDLPRPMPAELYRPLHQQGATL
jgi:hypothetical protein